jgi:hypothetical protein
VRLVTVDLRRTLLLQVRPTSVRTRRGHAATLVVTVDDPVTLRLRVRSGSRTLLTVTTDARTGSNTLHFGARLRTGRYRVWLDAASVRDRPAQATLTLAVSRD